ncbi:MAG: hypothetical protein QOG66_3472 [Methylobacteriaceae bacterium]|jgi:hypothetical protein|nr:hypothetical protein [Methylobacteriaceae bacterium]
MLRLFADAMSLVTWAYRLVVLAAIAFVLSTYGQPGPRTAGSASQTSYAEELQQALAGLRELARALQ